jgi:hypothetical protein
VHNIGVDITHQNFVYLIENFQFSVNKIRIAFINILGDKINKKYIKTASQKTNYLQLSESIFPPLFHNRWSPEAPSYFLYRLLSLMLTFEVKFSIISQPIHLFLQFIFSILFYFPPILTHYIVPDRQQSQLRLLLLKFFRARKGTFETYVTLKSTHTHTHIHLRLRAKREKQADIVAINYEK